MLALEWQYLHSLIHTHTHSLSNSKSDPLSSYTYLLHTWFILCVLSSFADAKLFDIQPSIYMQGHARAVHIRYVCF